MKDLPIGLKGQAETTVTERNTAAAMGSGLLPVFATPAMLALMENAAASSVQPYLDEGPGSVGTRLEVSHLAATPLGRFGDTDTALSGAVLFLLNNEAAGFITGVTIPIDGGFSAYSGV